MIKHLVFWNLKDDFNGQTKSEIALEIKRQLEDLHGKIPGLLEIEVGIDFSRTDASCDVSLYSAFESKEALDSYQSHPEHQKVAAFIGEGRTDRYVVDYETS